jgi:hypothetical protein
MLIELQTNQLIFKLETQQEAEIFAKSVVNAILTKPSRELYKGNFATMAWIISTFGPRWAFVSFPRRFLSTLVISKYH